MKKILILRHGKTEEGPDIPRFKGRHPVGLSEQGAYTLACVGVLMEAAGFQPDIIFSSTIYRAIQSASIFNRWQLPQYIIPNFDEVEPGGLTPYLNKMPLEEYDQKAADYQAESSKEVIARFLEGLNYVASLDEVDNALIISHSFLMHIVYPTLAKAPGVPETTLFDNGCGFWIDLSSDTPTITGLFPEL